MDKAPLSLTTLGECWQCKSFPDSLFIGRAMPVNLRGYGGSSKPTTVKKYDLPVLLISECCRREGVGGPARGLHTTGHGGLQVRLQRHV